MIRLKDEESVYVGHNGIVAGKLTMPSEDPSTWQWDSHGTIASTILEGRNPGEVPFFLTNLRPEGWLADVLEWKEGDHKSYVEESIRLLSNVVIGSSEKCIDAVVRDCHTTRLADHTSEDRVFKGYYDGPKERMTPHFNKRVGNNWRNPLMPRFSGYEVKLPMNLSIVEGDAVLSPAYGSAFTHIAKFGNEGPIRSTSPATEWMSLQLSEACGLETESFALIDVNKGSSYALIVERFDLVDKANADKEAILMNDFCTTLRVKTEAKYDHSIEEVADVMMQMSTSPEEDARALFKRVALAYFTRDNDMHLKNISLLKSRDNETGEISIRLAPTYDSVPSMIYPTEQKQRDLLTGEVTFDYISNDEQSISINGKHGGREDALTEEDFLTLSERLGIPEEEAIETVEEIARTCVSESVRILNNLPEILAQDPTTVFALARAATEIVNNAESYLCDDFSDILDYDDRVWGHKQLSSFIAEFGSRGQQAAPIMAAQ